jgi:hypothetical protein
LAARLGPLVVGGRRWAVAPAGLWRGPVGLVGAAGCAARFAGGGGQRGSVARGRWLRLVAWLGLLLVGGCGVGWVGCAAAEEGPRVSCGVGRVAARPGLLVAGGR